MRCTALFALLLFFVTNLSPQTTSGDSSQWKDVETAMGRSGQMQPGDVMKFGMPRKDLAGIARALTARALPCRSSSKSGFARR